MAAENSSLFGIKQKQASYGSTRKLDNTNECYIKHCVTAGETLAGICLKYGVQVESVKRINKIWTNDSLFVRDFILIPVLRDTSNDSNCSSCSDLNPNKDNASVELLSRQDIRTLQNMPKATVGTQESAAQSSSTEPTVNDFLSRMDSTLNQLRVHVSNLDRHTEFVEDITNPLSHLPKKGVTARYSSHRQRSNGSSSDSDVAFHSSASSVDPTSCQSFDRFSNETRSSDFYKL